MASDIVAEIYPKLVKQLAIGHDRGLQLVETGSLRGIALPKQTTGLTCVIKLPAGLTYTTGIKVTLMLTDDGTSSIDLGKVVRMGVTAKKLANDETTDIGTGAGTEQTTDFTLSSTSGGVVSTDVVLANANLDSAGAGDYVLLRIRRVSSATQDTCPGRVILLDAYAYVY